MFFTINVQLLSDEVSKNLENSVFLTGNFIVVLPLLMATRFFQTGQIAEFSK